MYSTDKKPIKEDCAIQPWTSVAKFKVPVEQHLESMDNFNYTVLRLPVVYGKSDRKGLSESDKYHCTLLIKTKIKIYIIF